MCLENAVFEPQPAAVATYEQLYALYRKLYFAFGSQDAVAVTLSDILPELKRIAAHVNAQPA